MRPRPWSASNLLKVLHRYRFDLAAEQFARQEALEKASKQAVCACVCGMVWQSVAWYGEVYAEIGKVNLI